MARPLKSGIDYFQHDVAMSSDDKIEALETIHGNDGYAVYCKVLERVYKSEGRLDLSDRVQRLTTANRCHVTPEKFDVIMADMVSLGLFEDALHPTSSRIREQLKIVLDEREEGRVRRQGGFPPGKPPDGAGFPPGKPDPDEVFPSENPTKESRGEQSREEQQPRARDAQAGQDPEPEGFAAWVAGLDRVRQARSPQAMARKLLREPDVLAEFRASREPQPKPALTSIPAPRIACACGGRLKSAEETAACTVCGAFFAFDFATREWRPAGADYAARDGPPVPMPESWEEARKQLRVERVAN